MLMAFSAVFILPALYFSATPYCFCIFINIQYVLKDFRYHLLIGDGCTDFFFKSLSEYMLLELTLNVMKTMTYQFDYLSESCLLEVARWGDQDG